MADTGFNAGAGYPVNDTIDGNLTVVDVYGTSQYGSVTARQFVGGGAGLTNLPVQAGILAWYSVKAYGAVGNGTTDDTTAINNAVAAAHAAGGGVVYFPKGVYLVSASINLYEFVTYTGDTAGDASSNTLGTTILVNSTSVSAFKYAASDVSVVGYEGITIENLQITGPSSGTGNGIRIVSNAESGGFFYASLRNVRVTNFGAQGFYFDTIDVANLTNCVANSNGGNGFHVAGIVGTVTSVSMTACYAVANTGYGYYFTNCTYLSLNACASDSNTTSGYNVNDCGTVALTGCGVEYGGGAGTSNGFTVSAGSGCITLTSCYVYAIQASGKAFWITGSSVNITLIGCLSGNPTSGSVGFQLDAGSTAVFINCQANGSTTTLTGVYQAITCDFTNALVSNGTVAQLNAGTSTAASTNVITPALGNGTPAQLSDLTRDYIVYWQVGTGGTAFTLAIGSASSVNKTLVSSATVVGGQTFTFRLPAGWYCYWSATTATLAHQSAVSC